MKDEILIPSKVRLIYTQVTDKKSKFYGRNVGLVVDIKSTKTSLTNAKNDLIQMLRNSSEVDNFEEEILDNSKIKISILPNIMDMSVYNNRVRCVMYPIKIHSKELPEDKDFIIFGLMTNIFSIISEVGNINKRLISGNFCFGQELDINFFGRLIYENPNDSDLTEAKKLGSIRDNKGKTSKWIPGHVYLVNKTFHLYLGNILGNIMVTEVNVSSSNINLNYNRIISWYSNAKIIKDFRLSISSSVNEFKKDTLENFMKLNFFNCLSNSNNGTVIARPLSSSAVSGVDCGNILTDIDKFNINLFIKSEAKKLFNNDLNSGKFNEILLSLIPEYLNENIDILKKYLNARVSTYKNSWSNRGYNSFKDFCKSNPNKVSDLLDGSWITLMNKQEISDYCEKIYTA